MKTTTVTLTVLENEGQAKRFLLDLEVKGPSLHPDVHSESSFKRWNGWNHAKAFGTDANGHLVEFESWHFAAGGTDFSTAVNGDTGHLGPRSFDRAGVVWPVQAFPAIPVIKHPEHTPA